MSSFFDFIFDISDPRPAFSRHFKISQPPDFAWFLSVFSFHLESAAAPLRSDDFTMLPPSQIRLRFISSSRVRAQAPAAFALRAAHFIFATLSVCFHCRPPPPLIRPRHDAARPPRSFCQEECARRHQSYTLLSGPEATPTRLRRPLTREPCAIAAR